MRGLINVCEEVASGGNGTKELVPPLEALRVHTKHVEKNEKNDKGTQKQKDGEKNVEKKKENTTRREGKETGDTGRSKEDGVGDRTGDNIGNLDELSVIDNSAFERMKESLDVVNKGTNM